MRTQLSVPTAIAIMKTSGLVAVLVGASVVEGFLPATSNSLALRQSQPSCVSGKSKPAVGRQSRAQQQQQYMVAAPAKEDTVAAVPHGGTLVDLNLKTDEEKKVRQAVWVFGDFLRMMIYERTTTYLLSV